MGSHRRSIGADDATGMAQARAGRSCFESEHDAPMSRSGVAAIVRGLACALLATLAGPSIAQTDARIAAAGGPLELPDVLAGIVHYTRWPDAVDSLRLCVTDKDPATLAALTRRFGASAAPVGRIEVVSVRIDAEAVASLLDCQVVYFGQAPAKAWRALLLELTRRPILTIGHGEDFCSYGGLFCLEAADSGVRLRVNLDSIARVGLRVNPQLLRLTQRAP
jgi:YfiR/HmsC-like